MAQNARFDRLKHHTTGGSTGVPFTIFSPSIVENKRVASLMATFLVNRHRPHEKIALFQAKPPKASFINRIGLFQRIDIPYHLNIEQQIERLMQIQAPVWEGYPSRIGPIARRVVGKQIKGLRPKLIITNSEVLTEKDANAIQQAFGIKPTNVYDAWEFGNIAWECTRHEGMHINSDRLIVETINQGATVVGAPGEVVITDLDNKAMPLIRYATGDIAVLATDACSCGRTFPLLTNVIGRKSEKLIMGDGTAMMATIPINACLKDIKGLCEYQATQRAVGELTIDVVADSDFTPAVEKRIKFVLLKNLKLKRVEINHVDAIRKTPSHKHRMFISEINS
jgi:phenylacetate-CoA ligase